MLLILTTKNFSKNSETNSTIIYSEKNETSDEKISFSLYNIEEEINSVASVNISRNFFGDRIAKMEYLYRKSCVIKTPVAPGNPGVRTIIKKPLIYKNVFRMSKHLKRKAKKGVISKETACEKYFKVLSVAYASVTENSKSFEKLLKKNKNKDDILRIFTEVELSSL